jgi:hypothetical protein
MSPPNYLRHVVRPYRARTARCCRLSGGLAFDISPTTPTEQWISEKEPTRWLVTPKAVGEQFLILSFDGLTRGLTSGPKPPRWGNLHGAMFQFEHLQQDGIVAGLKTKGGKR